MLELFLLFVGFYIAPIAALYVLSYFIQLGAPQPSRRYEYRRAIQDRPETRFCPGCGAISPDSCPANCKGPHR